MIFFFAVAAFTRFEWRALTSVAFQHSLSSAVETSRFVLSLLIMHHYRNWKQLCSQLFFFCSYLKINSLLFHYLRITKVVFLVIMGEVENECQVLWSCVIRAQSCVCWSMLRDWPAPNSLLQPAAAQIKTIRLTDIIKAHLFASSSQCA